MHCFLVVRGNLFIWEYKRTAVHHNESITLRPAGGLNTAMQAEPLNSVLPIQLLAWAAFLLHTSGGLAEHSGNVLGFFLA